MSPGIPRPDGPPPKGALTFVRQVLALGSWEGDFEPTTSLSMTGARAMSRLVLAHPAVADGARPDTPLALFDSTGDPRFDGLRSDSLGYIVAGALALGMAGRDITDDLAQKLVLAGVSTDPASLLQRHTLAGGKPFEPPPPAIPELARHDRRLHQAQLLRRRGRRRARARQVRGQHRDVRRHRHQQRVADERLPWHEADDLRLGLRRDPAGRHQGLRALRRRLPRGHRHALVRHRDRRDAARRRQRRLRRLRPRGHVELRRPAEGHRRADDLHGRRRRDLGPRLQQGRHADRDLPAVPPGRPEPHPVRRPPVDQRVPLHARAQRAGRDAGAVVERRERDQHHDRRGRRQRPGARAARGLAAARSARSRSPRSPGRRRCTAPTG